MECAIVMNIYAITATQSGQKFQGRINIGSQAMMLYVSGHSHAREQLLHKFCESAKILTLGKNQRLASWNELRHSDEITSFRHSPHTK